MNQTTFEIETAKKIMDTLSINEIGIVSLISKIITEQMLRFGCVIPNIAINKLNDYTLDYFNKQWSTNYKSLDEITDELDLQAIDDFKAGFCKALNLINHE